MPSPAVNPPKNPIDTKILRLRMKVGLSRSEMAKRLGISRAMLSMLEARKRRLSVSLRCRLAKEFGNSWTTE